MTRTRRITLALALCSAALTAGGIARADDAMKIDSGGMMKSGDAMMKADAMKTDDTALADCKEKAGMEADQTKKDEAMKTCDAMAPAK